VSGCRLEVNEGGGSNADAVLIAVIIEPREH